MTPLKRSNIILYALCLGMCAASYIILNRNIELTLLPHKTVLSYLFNFNFIFKEGVGYEQTNGLFTVAKNCMGIKLFINLFIMMVFGFLHNYTGLKRKIAAMAKFYLLSLALAFIITIIRISVSVPFCTWDKFVPIHNTISLLIYFISGLILYFVMERRRLSDEKN